MLLRLDGVPQNYPWGSESLISDYFRFPKSEGRVAEIWFGTHPMGESRIEGKPLSELIGRRLGYLVKILAADSPLSLQVHPNTVQAREGFERENALGLALTDPTRNYRDTSDKPEVLVALTQFRALCGFRILAETEMVLRELAEVIPGFEGHLLALQSGISLEDLFLRLQQDFELARNFPVDISEVKLAPATKSSLQLTRELLELYPGDTGALISILMNQVTLSPGEAIFLPAGNLHAYISGLGVEVMAASDNVIRGGLTKKHIDTAELMKILTFEELSNPLVQPRRVAHGMIEYPTAATAFRIYRAEVSGSNLFADLELPDSGIVLCIDGEVALSTSTGEREILKASEAAFISTCKTFSLSGSGTVFVTLGN